MLNDSESLDFVEYFAGVEAVTGAMLGAGLAAVGYEIKKHNIFMDILHPQGFLCAMEFALRLKCGFGGGSLAPVCSTWVGAVLMDCPNYY